MTNAIPIEEVQDRLKELIHQLRPGDEMLITEDGRTVAKLISEGSPVMSNPKPGLGKGSIIYMSPDFDEPLDEMTEYMHG
jgi:antitoxin (DNA-binding transcriptional repressor) of toxin-antitoxin stability system